MMCEQCEVLAEENRRLKEMLAGGDGFDPAMLLLTKRQRILYQVMRRWPVAAYELLADAMIAASVKGDDLDDPFRLVKVQVHHMRRRLKPAGVHILTVHGLGYRLVREAA